MSQSFDVLVRGAGIVGKTTALLLAQSRLRVGLIGRPAVHPGPDVRAYALNAASRSLLQSLRAWPEPQFCTPVARMQVWGDDGGAVEFKAQDLACEALAWIVDVPALEAALSAALHYQPLIERLPVDVPAPVSSALTVVSEGAASANRSSRVIEFVAMPYPQHAIAARLRCALGHGGVARQWFVRSERGAEVLALLPMQGDEVALVWSVPSAQVAALLALSPAAFEQALQASCAMAGGAAGEGALPGALQLVSERAAWPLQRAQASRWVEAGFALVGDAAHTVHPLAGQGLNLGLADAAELARVVAGREYWRAPGDVKVLRRYERARKADVARTGFASDALERLFAHTDPRVQALRNWGMQGFARSGPLKDWIARQAMGV